MGRDMDERRGSVRLPMAVRVLLTWRGGRFAGVTTDLSVHGLFLETARSLPSGTAVRLDFDLVRSGRTGHIVADGRVVRIVRAPDASGAGRTIGLGVEFDSVLEGLPALQDYVSERLARAKTVADAKDGAERRSRPRLPAGLPVKWGTNPNPAEEGLLTNLSESGSFLVSAEGGVEPGTRIYLQFEIVERGQPRQVRAVCRVVRTAGKGMGIVFDVASIDTEAIAYFVRKRCSKAG